MPDCKQHQDKSTSNLEVATALITLDKVPNDWIVTLYFYTALHLVEKKLADKAIHSETHSIRFRNIRQHLRTIFIEYQALYNESLEARYNCTEMTPGKVNNAKQNLDSITQKLSS
ncbi:hypothetical protein PAEVO_03910 [Paenibacillus sp. GM2FR]|uniref:hypothetical protein n=1 Tax=Paenibacillus sp. GM2FR TaxID=2059268 RepID=UPI000C26E6E8|nr:hypothetical protein [Paenibacillus sp. GM2FR]PJN53670.1 hypothetical protein PAEVO_03910 [Paenibacillus sp. GM2FR]